MKQTVIHNVIPNGSTFTYDKRKYHVVNSFPDIGNYIYVVRYYGKYKQWWHYEAWDAYTVDLRMESGMIKNLKRKRIQPY